MALNLTTKKEGSALAVALEGELNTTTAPELKDLLDKSIPEADALSLDFAGCDFVSSAGLRVLLNTYKSMKAKKGTMELINVGPSFKEVLNITGLDAVFDVK
jgi:anti-sigma B factor antagonist